MRRWNFYNNRLCRFLCFIMQTEVFLENLLYFEKIRCTIRYEINTGELVYAG